MSQEELEIQVGSQTVLKERIQDEEGFGVEIQWTVRSGGVDFQVHELAVAEPQAVAGPEPEAFLTGFVKRDGCAELTLHDTLHLCGYPYWHRHLALLSHLYVRSFDLMGAEPPDQEGRAVFREAVASRAAEERPGVVDTPLSRFLAAVAHLDDFPEAVAGRGHMEAVRLHELLVELASRWGQLSLDEQAQVPAAVAERMSREWTRMQPALA